MVEKNFLIMYFGHYGHSKRNVENHTIGTTYIFFVHNWETSFFVVRSLFLYTYIWKLNKDLSSFLFSHNFVVVLNNFLSNYQQ